MADLVNETKNFDALLLDSFLEGMYGGTGIMNDFQACMEIRVAIHPKPIILAGGLTANNVKEAIQIVQPFAVDVSSGVESYPGIKDHRKIWEFIKIVKETGIEKNQ